MNRFEVSLRVVVVLGAGLVASCSKVETRGGEQNEKVVGGGAGGGQTGAGDVDVSAGTSAASTKASAGTSEENQVSKVRPVLVIVHSTELRAVAREWAEYRRSQSGGGWEVELIDVASMGAGGAGSGGQTNLERAKGLREELRERFASLKAAGGGQGASPPMAMGGLSEEPLPHGRGSLNQGAPRPPAAALSGEFMVMLLGDVPDESGDEAVVVSGAESDGRGGESGEGIPTFHHVQKDRALIGGDGLADIATDNDYQLADDADETPDFALGRVPARTVLEARAVLAKVRVYETATPAGEWRRRITYLAGEGHFGAAMDGLLERMFMAMVERAVPYEFDVNATYANPLSPYCAPPSKFEELVMERLGEGALLVNYVGHGQVRHLDRLTWNGRGYDLCDRAAISRLNLVEAPLGANPVMLIVACWTGRFDLAGGEECLSETMLLEPRGPVGIESGSRITHPYANAVFQKHFTQAMCVERLATLGEIDLEATRRLAAINDADDEAMEGLATVLAATMGWDSTPTELRMMHVGLYNLLGDPATRIAYPGREIEGLEFDRETGEVRGSVGARVGGAGQGAVMVEVTLETTRSEIWRQGELMKVDGRGDPELEAKAARNYEIANDKVMWKGEGVVEGDGRFVVEIPREVVERALARRTKARGKVTGADGVVMDVPTTWIKVYVASEDGREDAFGAVAVD